jgi:hypothetical protein
MSNFKFKYIKYKNKYLKLKNLYGGMEPEDEIQLVDDTIIDDNDKYTLEDEDINRMVEITEGYVVNKDEIIRQITEIANKIFIVNSTVLDIKVTVYTSFIQINISCGIDNDIILMLNPEDETLSIEILIKCHENTGKIMLEQIISFAYNLNNIQLLNNSKLTLRKLTLTDASFILLGNIRYKKKIPISKILEGNKNKTILGCKYSLGYLQIILNNQSWYNRFGFFSEEHESEQIYNKKILNLNLQELIDKITIEEIRSFENFFKIINNNQIRKSYLNKNTNNISKKILLILDSLNIKNESDYNIKTEKYLEKKKIDIITKNNSLLINIFTNFQDLYSNEEQMNINDDNIQNIMKKINDKYIKIESKYNCTDKKIKIITSLINKTGSILKYDLSLTKIL